MEKTCCVAVMSCAADCSIQPNREDGHRLGHRNGFEFPCMCVCIYQEYMRAAVHDVVFVLSIEQCSFLRNLKLNANMRLLAIAYR